MDMPVMAEDDVEPIYRAAGRIITETLTLYNQKYGGKKSEKELLYMAMLDMAVRMQTEIKSVDKTPLNAVLKKLTTEIEEALGEKKSKTNKNI